MRTLALSILFAAAACSDDDKTRDLGASNDLSASADLSHLDLASASDAATPPDLFVPPDLLAPPDLACPFQFIGGVDAASQGWTVYSIQPATATLVASYTQLATSTPNGGQSGGQLLFAKQLVTPGTAFAVDVVAKVVATNGHNQLDAAVAIMGSLTGQVGTQTDRSEMIYIDAAKIGWADDTQSAAANALDDAFHTYRLSVDAAGNATVARDGTPLLTRTHFTTNGIIAFGDQTNDANFDATSQLQSIQLVCNP